MKKIDFNSRLINLLFILTPALLAVWGTISLFLLMVGELTAVNLSIISIPVSAVVAAQYWKHAITDAPGSPREQVYVGLIVLLFVCGWVVFNAKFTAEHFFVNRDPGVYAVTAAHISDHGDLEFDNPNVFGSNSGGSSASAGFALDEGELYSQGQHLVPALVGAGGNAIGIQNAMHLVVLFGGFALMSIYSLASRFTLPRWAAVSTVVFSAVFPLIHLARDTYTEPIAAALTLGAVVLFWVAYKSSSKFLWVVAGLTLGATTMNRIDAYIALAGLLLALFLSLIFAHSKGKIKKANSAFMYSLVGLAISTILGFYDLAIKSPVYYESSFKNIKPMFALVIFVMFAGLVGVFIARKTKLIQKIDQKTKPYAAELSVIAILATAIFLASRVLWLNVRQANFNGLLVGIQEREGFATDGYRTYAELTTDWLGWYLGWTLVALGLIGLCIIVYRTVKYRNEIYLPFLLIFGISTLIYLLRPSISPDQVWASRRFLSIAMPSIAVLAAVGLQTGFAIFKQSIQKQILYAGVIAVVGVLLIQPLQISRPFVLERENAQLAPVLEVCSLLDSVENPAVLWLGSSSWQLPQTTNTFCGIPSSSFSVAGNPFKWRDASSESLAVAAKNAIEAGYTPVAGIFISQLSLAETGSNFTTTSPHIFYYSERTITGPPKSRTGSDATIGLGIINSEGVIDFLMDSR